MADPLSARDEVMRRIRIANRAANGAASAPADVAWHSIERAYRAHGDRSAAANLQLLEERLLEYDASVFHAIGENIASVVARAFAARGIFQALTPPGLPTAWLPDAVEFVADTNLSATRIDAFPAVMTTATLAIAETGTIVLQAVPGQGRRAISLIPDCHLCIVRTSSVVETVVESTRRLQSTARLPSTWISGPSATADIEMTRIKGVHGPRFLDVILLADE